MQASPTRLKKPLHLWLARIIAFGLVLSSIGMSVSWLPEILEKIKHDGVVRDVMWGLNESGEAIVQYVSTEAAQKGVSIGDKVLNPEDDNIGRIGTAVTLRIQSGTAPVRDLTFLREPENEVTYGGTLLGLTFDRSTTLTFLFILIPTIVAALASLMICWLRSDDWMALLTAVVLSGLAMPVFPSTNPAVIILSTLTAMLAFSWFLLFPNGKLIPRWSWTILLLLLPSLLFRTAIELGLLTWNDRLAPTEQTFGLLVTVAGLAIIAIIYYRYRYLFSPIERQQSKWVITALIIGLLPLILTALFYSTYWYAHRFEESAIAYFFNYITGVVLTILLVLGILFSIFQYRLYDVDIFVSRAIVYSALTGILALVGFATSVIIDYILKQALGSQPGLVPAMFSAVPIAALFNPVRERLQNIVDRHFRHEIVDFENTFIEFTSELRSLFTTEELSTLLSHHAVEQLDVTYASVFLNGQNGNLKHIKTTSLEEEISDLALDNETVEKLKSGQIVSPNGDSAESLVIPLMVPRSRKPSLLGALVLGPRVQGLGYSTAMLKSLKKFGGEVGKAFYAAEIRDKKKS
jgi:hypothetical protein